ncbi:MAG: CapA family protein [Alphaproteobacteria bacterium]
MFFSHSPRARDPYWDNLKGILIALVVFGHYTFEYSQHLDVSYLTKFIYIFHMPAFIFISGYFSKYNAQKHLVNLAKILLLFILLNYSMMFYAHYVTGYDASFFSSYYSAWYLLALFLYRLILPFVPRHYGTVLLAYMVSILIGFIPGINEIWNLQKIIALSPFFFAGVVAARSSDPIKHFGLSARRHYFVESLLLSGFIVLFAFYLVLSGLVGTGQVMWYEYYATEDIVRRLITITVACLVCMPFIIFVPHTHVPLLSQWGRNSLSIYVLHRLFTLLLVFYFPSMMGEKYGWFLLPVISLSTIFILGTDVLSKALNHAFNWIFYTLFPEKPSTCLRIQTILPLFIIGILAGLLISSENPQNWRITKWVYGWYNSFGQDQDYMAPVISDTMHSEIHNAVSISFVGDLILLRDQVYKAYESSSGSYNYDSLFEYTQDYFKKDDFSIGVFEGPAAGAGNEYSTSEYADGIPLYLNFPDSFATSIKNAGIDFVTTANNHLLDMKEEGAYRTLDVLERAGLMQSGSYRDDEDKRQRDVTLINVKELKIAVLAFTYASNYYTDSYFFDEKNDHLTSLVVDPASPFFQEAKAKVIDTFERAKAQNPDTIIVLPHMGEQFRHSPDKFQKTWVDIFVEAGADVIFSAQPHAVQPIEWRKATRPGKGYAMIVHCPGNYVNSYLDYNGDAMALVQAYLDPETGSPIAAGVVPMWAQSMMNGLYRALPIYDIIRNPALQKEISTHDLRRTKEAHALVTSVMLGQELTVDQIQKIYYLLPEGYVRQPVQPIEITDSMKSTPFYTMLEEAEKVCFIGDSITEGTKNGGYGWYEPLMQSIPERAVCKNAHGGATVKTTFSSLDDISKDADLYVIALGTNDVRYRREDICAMSSAEYIYYIDKIVNGITAKNKDAQFVFIGAWTTDHYDPLSVLEKDARMEMLREYRDSLQKYSIENNYLYIDPNPCIEDVIRADYVRHYLLDHIHPNAHDGIRLYSHSVLNKKCTTP